MRVLIIALLLVPLTVAYYYITDEPELVGGWYLDESVDEMDDSRITLALMRSEDDGGFMGQHRGFILRCEGDEELDLIVSWEDYVPDRYTSIRVRMGDGAAERIPTSLWSRTHSMDGFFVDGRLKAYIIRKLVEVETMRFEVDGGGRSTTEFRMDPAAFPQVIDHLHCVG